MPSYYGTRSPARHPSARSSVYPDLTAIRAFVRETGIPESEQVRIRQTLMLEDVLRLSAIGNAWAYALEARS